MTEPDMNDPIKPISYSEVVSSDASRTNSFIDAMMTQLYEFRCIRLVDVDFVKSGLLNKAIILNKALHALPEDVKAKYIPTMDDGHHMYNGFGFHPLGCEVNKQGEMVGRRSFFTCLRPTPEGHPPYPHYFENDPIWPQEPSLPDFDKVNTEMMGSLVSSFSNMMRLICEGLDYNFDDYKQCVTNTALDYRGNCYERLKDTAALVEHSDNTLLTYIFGANCDGLRIRAKNGEWIKFRTRPNEVTIILGDAIQMSTGDALEATPHAVWTDNIEDKYRFGFNAFFTGSADSAMPIYGHKEKNTLLLQYPEHEGLSSLDGCDLRWRDYVDKNLGDILFYPQPERRRFF